MIVREVDAHRTMCPWNNFQGCFGSRCMAWQPRGPRVERTTTLNLIETAEGPRPDGDPPRPGDGWSADGPTYLTGYENSAKLKLPKATAQRWVRETARAEGTCGRAATHDHHDYF